MKLLFSIQIIIKILINEILFRKYYNVNPENHSSIDTIPLKIVGNIIHKMVRENINSCFEFEIWPSNFLLITNEMSWNVEEIIHDNLVSYNDCINLMDGFLLNLNLLSRKVSIV